MVVEAVALGAGYCSQPLRLSNSFYLTHQQLVILNGEINEQSQLSLANGAAVSSGIGSALTHSAVSSRSPLL